MRSDTKTLANAKLLLEQKEALSSGLCPMTIKTFMREYRDELCDYFDMNHETLSNLRDEDGDDAFICMVDKSRTASPSKKIRRRAGSWRKKTYKHRYTYENPMNRIIAFASLDHCSNCPDDKNVIGLNVIGSTHFSTLRGAGKDLMRILGMLAKSNDYTHMVLEVSNEYSGEGHYSDDEDEDEDEDDDLDEDEGEDEDDDDDDDDLDEIIEIVSHELWRKTVRMHKTTGVAYYNISEDYISSALENHLYGPRILHDTVLDDDGEKMELIPLFKDEAEPRDTSYGGFWYKKGKKSQALLMGFYEHMGFVEAPEVHKEWGYTSNIPYPTMIKRL